MDKKLSVIIATGGTGGHIFPAHALADELLLSHNITPIFITDQNYEKYNKTQYKYKIIKSSPLSSIKSLYKIPIGVMQAMIAIKFSNAKICVGFGGYPTFPTLLAAKILGLKIIIHEQNSFLGKVNRVFAKSALFTAISFQNTHGVDGVNTVFTGNPVRKFIASRLNEAKYFLPNSDEKFNILVIGGSQGASIFADLMVDAVRFLPAQICSKLQIIHQASDVQAEKLKAAFDAVGVASEISKFFYDIEEKIALSHLIIMRAGSSSLAEMAMAARPMILIPLPSAANDHQTYNAKIFEEAGAAILLKQKDLSSSNLATELTSLISNQDRLSRMSVASKGLAHSDSAKKIASLVASS